MGERLLDPRVEERLLQEAFGAREHAYAPYSGFRVGAAVLAASGGLYRGCNVENASYGGTICAERAALFSAVAGGERSFVAVAVATEAVKPSVPCGLCLQVLAEFGDWLIIAATPGATVRLPLSELLPHPFRAVFRGKNGHL